MEEIKNHGNVVMKNYMHMDIVKTVMLMSITRQVNC